MVSIYKDMSDLDPSRIRDAVDTIEKVFDEDKSGTVGTLRFDMFDLFSMMLTNLK